MEIARHVGKELASARWEERHKRFPSLVAYDFGCENISNKSMLTDAQQLVVALQGMFLTPSPSRGRGCVLFS